MKTMYLTHGENLLSKFRSIEPIRTALGQVDENDRLRTEALRKVASCSDRKMVSAVNSATTVKNIDRAKTIEQGEFAPMDASKDIVPQATPHSQ